jgi:hypothetical protein
MRRFGAFFASGIAVASDRSVRFLSALGGASTSRVLNLARIAADNADNDDMAKTAFVCPPSTARSAQASHLF